MTPSRRRPLSALLVLLGLLLAGCASDAELDTLNPQADNARDIDALFTGVIIVAGIIGTLVAGAILYMSVRNRVKDYTEDSWPKQTHGHNTLEILWTAVPALIMCGVAVGTVVTHLAINETEANAIEIEVDGASTSWEPKVVVVGQQWWWEYRYYFGDDVTPDMLGNPKDLPPADIVTSGQMAIPTGQEIELLVTSRDVIHSFWIPALNGKRDARPGFFAPWELSADDPGVYFGQCTEFCGVSHSRMRMQVVAMTDADFQTWIDQQMSPAETPTDEAAVRGMEAFEANCTSCHLVNGLNDGTYSGASTASGSAPDLTHFASRTTFAGGIFNTYNPDGSINRDELADWLRDPAAVKANAADGLGDGVAPRGMPNLGLSERTISDLIAYLETLGAKPSDEIIAATEVD